jgi:hypothetical protein
MVRALTAVLLGGLALLGACSGQTLEEDEDDVDTVPAPQRCQTYASTWCNKSFGCYVEVGRMKETERQRNVTECIQIIVDKLPCSKVTSVSDDYDTCISQIEGMSCSRWDVPTSSFGTITPPDSCDYALSF